MDNKILKWSLILSTVIIANLFFNYALSLTFNGPNHDEFCTFEKTSQVVETKQQCEELDGIWNPQERIQPDVNLKPVGYCDLYSKCGNEFNIAKEIYEQKVFVALVIIGVIILSASIFISTNSVLSSALALTAVLDLIVAAVRYWQYSKEFLKVSILFIALATLIYLIFKKFKDK